MVPLMDKPIRIFMSRPCWNEHGGPTSHLPLLIEALRSDPNVALWTFVYGSRRVGRLPRKLTDSLAARMLLVLLDFARFLGLCLRHGRPDILHLNSSYESRAVLRDLPYLLAGRLLRFKVVVKTHGSDEHFTRNRAIQWRLVKVLHGKLLTAMTLLSPVETDQFKRARPQDASKFWTAKNIVEFDPPQAAKREPGRILFAGRFVTKKNIPVLLHAFAALALDRDDVTLTMAGSGYLERDLRNLAEELGVADRVLWTGWLDRRTLRQLCARCSVVAFSSTGSEGMPMVIIEALISGARLVASPVRFVRSYSMAGMGVIELQGDTKEELEGALRRALAEEAPGRSMQERRSEFLGQFSRGVVSRDFIQIYSKVTGRHVA